MYILYTKCEEEKNWIITGVFDTEHDANLYKEGSEIAYENVECKTQLIDGDLKDIINVEGISIKTIVQLLLKEWEKKSEPEPVKDGAKKALEEVLEIIRSDKLEWISTCELLSPAYCADRGRVHNDVQVPIPFCNSEIKNCPYRGTMNINTELFKNKQALERAVSARILQF